MSLDSARGCSVSHWSLVIGNEKNQDQEGDAERLDRQDGCAGLLPSPSWGSESVKTFCNQVGLQQG